MRHNEFDFARQVRPFPQDAGDLQQDASARTAVVRAHEPRVLENLRVVMRADEKRRRGLAVEGRD